MTGAQNHQPVCPANRTSPPEDIAAANCDRDEGDSGVRFNQAFQAYMEWMPVRYQPGSMGQIDLGSFTQIIQWGDLATFITLDTRISYRSQDPTVGSGPLDSFGFVASMYPNVSAYSDPNSEESAAILNATKSELARQYDPQFSLIGAYMDVLAEVFSDSAKAGKPWQIWAANVMVGPFILPDIRLFPGVVADMYKPAFEQYLDTLLPSSSGVQARAVAAAAEGKVPSNRDSFAGFSAETVKILEIARDTAKNMVILGGDVHDSYAWTIYEDYNQTGTPIAVNLVCPGVTSNGLGPAYFAALEPLNASLGEDVIYNSIDAAAEATNPGLIFTNQRNKGFFAVSVTPTEHTAEYFLLETPTLMTSFEDARTESGKLTADFFCASSLTTTAGEKGSLVENSECSAITFVNQRSSVLSLSVPVQPLGDSASDLKNCGYMGCAFAPQTGDPTQAPSTTSQSPPLALVATIVVIFSAMLLPMLTA